MDKTKILIILGICVLSFAGGRFSSPAKVVTETKIVTVEKIVSDTKTDKNDHKTVTVVEVTNPDGTKTKTTKITDDKNSKSESSSTTEVSKNSDTTKEVTKSSSKIMISALAGLNVNNLSAPIYGGAVSKSILGPITVGAFGLSNGVGGVSLGLCF